MGMRCLSDKKHTDLEETILLTITLYDLQGVANRGASIRVGRETEQNGKGQIPSLHFLSFVHFLTVFTASTWHAIA